MEISGLRSRIINSRNAPFNIFKQFKTEIISPLKKKPGSKKFCNWPIKKHRKSAKYYET